MIRRDLIVKELNDLKITKFEGYYWYFYCTIIEELAVAKPGSSQVHLANRINNYLNVEHSNQHKKEFFMLAVIEFKTPRSLTAAENFIKKNNSDRFDVFKDQPRALEQYQLKPFWDEIKPYLTNFPFAIKSYINPHADRIVSEVVKSQLIPYKTISYKHRYSQEKNSPSDIIEKTKLTSEPNWLRKINNINNDPHCIQNIIGIGPKTVEAFVYIINEKPITNVSINAARDDITSRTKNYNSVFSCKAKYNSVIQWILCQS